MALRWEELLGKICIYLGNIGEVEVKRYLVALPSIVIKMLCGTSLVPNRSIDSIVDDLWQPCFP